MAKFPLKNVLEGTKHFWTKSQGPDAEGAAATANPLTIGYKDAEGKATGVTPTNMLPVGDAAAQAKLADILTKLSADPATQTTLAQILAKIIAAPATEAKQTALNALVGEVQATPTANTLLARLKNLETKVDAIIADGIKLSGSNIPDAQSIPTKKVTKKTITTVINAVAVAAGAHAGYVLLGTDGTEDEVWLAVNIDKQPWTLTSKTIFDNNAEDCVYPSYKNANKTYPGFTTPAMSLVVGLNYGFQGLAVPTTLQEAKQIKVPLDSAINVRVDNKSAETATVTVRVLRIWR